MTDPLPLEGELGLRWLVPSRRYPEGPPHLVDLSYFHGNGACCCADFIGNCLGPIRDGHPLFTKATSCHHLRAVWKIWFANAIEGYLTHTQQHQPDEGFPFLRPDGKNSKPVSEPNGSSGEVPANGQGAKGVR